jgi:hypothetical protein
MSQATSDVPAVMQQSALYDSQHCLWGQPCRVLEEDVHVVQFGARFLVSRKYLRQSFCNFCGELWHGMRGDWSSHTWRNTRESSVAQPSQTRV